MAADPANQNIFYQSVNGQPIVLRKNAPLPIIQNGAHIYKFVQASESLGTRPHGGRLQLMYGTSPAINLNKPKFVQDLTYRAAHQEIVQPRLFSGGILSDEDRRNQKMAPVSLEAAAKINRELTTALQAFVSDNVQKSHEILNKISQMGLQQALTPEQIKAIVQQFIQHNKNNQQGHIAHQAGHEFRYKDIDMNPHIATLASGVSSAIKTAFDQTYKEALKRKREFEKDSPPGDHGSAEVNQNPLKKIKVTKDWSEPKDPSLIEHKENNDMDMDQKPKQAEQTGRDDRIDHLVDALNAFMTLLKRHFGLSDQDEYQMSGSFGGPPPDNPPGAGAIGMMNSTQGPLFNSRLTGLKPPGSPDNDFMGTGFGRPPDNPPAPGAVQIDTHAEILKSMKTILAELKAMVGTRDPAVTELTSSVTALKNAVAEMMTELKKAPAVPPNFYQEVRVNAPPIPEEYTRTLDATNDILTAMKQELTDLKEKSSKADQAISAVDALSDKLEKKDSNNDEMENAIHRLATAIETVIAEKQLAPSETEKLLKLKQDLEVREKAIATAVSSGISSGMEKVNTANKELIEKLNARIIEIENNMLNFIKEVTENMKPDSTGTETILQKINEAVLSLQSTINNTRRTLEGNQSQLAMNQAGSLVGQSQLWSGIVSLSQGQAIIGGKVDFVATQLSTLQKMVLSGILLLTDLTMKMNNFVIPLLQNLNVPLVSLIDTIYRAFILKAANDIGKSAYEMKRQRDLEKEFDNFVDYGQVKNGIDQLAEGMTKEGIPFEDRSTIVPTLCKSFVHGENWRIRDELNRLLSANPDLAQYENDIIHILGDSQFADEEVVDLVKNNIESENKVMNKMQNAAKLIIDSASLGYKGKELDDRMKYSIEEIGQELLPLKDHPRAPTMIKGASFKFLIDEVKNFDKLANSRYHKPYLPQSTPDTFDGAIQYLAGNLEYYLIAKGYIKPPKRVMNPDAPNVPPSNNPGNDDDDDEEYAELLALYG